LGAEARFSIFFIMIGMVATMAIIANLIETYVKDKFLAMSIIFAPSS
jgi:hypothetical protein